MYIIIHAHLISETHFDFCSVSEGKNEECVCVRVFNTCNKSATLLSN